ncbi:MAG TPA: hypothetical protein VE954_11900, partial [Oligoflexus sp.]|uniref:hypothetical protein n=1 Tax=Oligoflexus sp. TaxID=1971216 RepID=UPI002D63BD1D
KECKLILDRDLNAALVILNYALTGFVTGREPASGVEEKNSFPVKHETASGRIWKREMIEQIKTRIRLELAPFRRYAPGFPCFCAIEIPIQFDSQLTTRIVQQGLATTLAS